MRKLQRSLLASAITLSLAASAHADTQFSNVYFFGDSYTDIGLVQAGAAAGYRNVHDQSRAGVGAAVRTVFRLFARPRQSGWQRLRLRRRARDAVCRAYPPAAPTARGSANRDSGPAVDWRKARRPECVLFGLGRRQRLLLPVLPVLNRAWRRRRKCRPPWDGRGANSRSRSRAPCRGRADTSLVWNVPGHRQDCRRMPGIRRSARSTQSSIFITPRSTAHSTPPGVQTIRVNAFSARKRGGCQSDRLRVSRT